LVFEVSGNLLLCISDAAATDTGVTEPSALPLAFDGLRRAAQRQGDFPFGQ
jgi:hypothetical protein